MTDYEWEMANGLALSTGINGTSTASSTANGTYGPEAPAWFERFRWTRQITIFGWFVIEVARMEDYPSIRFSFTLI